MGLFSSSSPSPPAPRLADDGKPIAPDRDQRAHCWEARDAYFRCLDRAEVVDAITDKDKAERACPREGREFEGACAKSWVTYFKQRRVMEYKRDQTIRKLDAEGATAIPGQLPPSAASQSAKAPGA